MTRLILVRHGFSQANAEDRFAGHSDFPLTDIGHRQAASAAEYLYKTEKIDKIYASDLLRAYHTATPTAEKFGLEVIPDPRLREIYAGKWEGIRFLDLVTEYESDFRMWKTDFGRAFCTGGESVAELFDRVTEAVCDIARQNDGKCVMIASHATPLRAIECFAAGKTAYDMCDFAFPANASIQIYRYEQDTLIPERLNVVDHLVGMMTELPKGV